LADAADPRQLERLLGAGGVTAKRSFGQNFLVDRDLRDRVLEEAGIAPEDEVLEVGAGPGTLTVQLAGRCRRLVAVELDRGLLRILRHQVEGLPNVEVVEADILKLDTASLFPGGGEVVLGNIPYYLTGALVSRLLERPRPPRRLSFVVQLEVAERWTAETGGSLSSVAVQVLARPRLALRLPAAAFDPRPKVDSALVVMDVRERPAVDVDDLHAFFRFVESVFQFRRKQLGGTLARLTGRSRDDVAAALARIPVDPAQRPETLSLPQWESVYQEFSA
jgi:16S rRNA (adenine1518-N6/adenine1519-N6)-dimethyltransferase